MTPRSCFVQAPVTARLALALPAMALAGAVLAGCAASSPSPAASSAAPSSPGASTASDAAGSTPSAGSSPSHPASSAHPASSVNPGGPMAGSECTSDQLKVAYTDNAQIRDGALDGMSHADSVITFTNVSGKTCWTKGYPGVTALNAAGHEIKNAARGPAAGGRIPLITLAPGQLASAEITGNTASCSSLTKISRFLVTVPDQRTFAQLPGSREMCINSLGINPLARGNAGGLSL